jgi:SHS2 domain-containing protein
VSSWCTPEQGAGPPDRGRPAGEGGDYGYFSHDADVGVIGRGTTPATALEAAAAATFALMADLPALRPRVAVRFEFEEPDVELALVTWLNRLLAEGRAAGLALGRFRLRREDTQWIGEAWGEPWRPDLQKGVEVKGATLTALAVGPDAAGWEARCVVDV